VCSRLVQQGPGAAPLHVSGAGEGSWTKEKRPDEAPEVPAFWKGAMTSRRWHLNTVPQKGESRCRDPWSASYLLATAHSGWNDRQHLAHGDLRLAIDVIN
jgi:hypothetical protein